MKIELATEEHFEDIIQLLKKGFYSDEPLNKAVNLCQPGEGHPQLSQHSLITLRGGMSLVALDDENR